jgi:hypothetical protein
VIWAQYGFFIKGYQTYKKEIGLVSSFYGSDTGDQRPGQNLENKTDDEIKKEVADELKNNRSAYSFSYLDYKIAGLLHFVKCLPFKCVENRVKR